MCLECLKKAASSYDRLPLTPHKPPAAPTGIPAIQALSVPERRGIVAQVRRLIWKSFPNGRASGAFQGRAIQVASKSPHAASGALSSPNFFEFFLRAGAIQPLSDFLTCCNRVDFSNNPPCDDFLTMVVDNPDGWGL